MANTNTSIGRGPSSGGNENHDGDPTRSTLGETVGQEAPAGRDGEAPPRESRAPVTQADGGPATREGDAVDGAPDMPAGVAGGAAHPAIRKGPESYPDGPNVEDSPWELDAARGKLPRQSTGGTEGPGKE